MSTETRPLADLLAPVRHVLLDFDGPVCSVFAGLPAPIVATRLAAGLAEAPADWLTEDDPMALLRRIAADRPSAVSTTDSTLERLENEAVQLAQPTPGSAEVLKACAASGRLVWVVSNNAGSAIRAYLAQTGLGGYVAGVFGRPIGDPSSMKPNPRLLTEALTAASADAARCIFIGDTITDVHAGQAAGVRTIGYANKPGKEEALTSAGAVAVVTSMDRLAEALR